MVSRADTPSPLGNPARQLKLHSSSLSVLSLIPPYRFLRIISQFLNARLENGHHSPTVALKSLPRQHKQKFFVSLHRLFLYSTLSSLKGPVKPMASVLVLNALVRRATLNIVVFAVFVTVTNVTPNQVVKVLRRYELTYFQTSEGPSLCIF